MIADLIWVGNILYPRELVFGIIGLMFFTIIAGFVIITDKDNS